MQSIYALLLASTTVSGPTGTSVLDSDVDTKLFQDCTVTKIMELDVPARQQGILDVMEVEKGSLVKKGALLAKVDDEDAQLALQIAVYERDTAVMLAEDTVRERAAVAQYKVSNAEHQEAVFANKKVPSTYPKTDVRRRRFTADRDNLLIEKEKMDRMMAAIDANAKKTQQRRAKAFVDRHLIQAPFDGEVTLIHKHAKEWVNPGDPVFRLVRMDKLRVVGFVPVKDFARHDLIGRPVTIEVTTTGGGVERIGGEISYVANKVSGGRFQIGADFDNQIVSSPRGDVWLMNPGLEASIRLHDGVALRGDSSPRRRQ